MEAHLLGPHPKLQSVQISIVFTAPAVQVVILQVVIFEDEG